MEPVQESTIEKDFESSFDDSFVLRTKPMQMDISDSGCRIQNTFSFAEAESEEPQIESGIMRLLKMGRDRKENFFKFHVMDKKVTL